MELFLHSSDFRWETDLRNLFFMWWRLFWTLDVSQTTSNEITVVRSSVLPSVTKFSQDWIIVFFLILYMIIADHDIK